MGGECGGIRQTVSDVDGVAVDARVVDHLGGAPRPGVQRGGVCLKIGGVAGGGPGYFVRRYTRGGEIRVIGEGEAGGGAEGRTVHGVGDGGDEAFAAFGGEGDFVGEGAVETKRVVVDGAAPGGPVGGGGEGDGGYPDVLGDVGGAGAEAEAFEGFPDAGPAGAGWGDFAGKSAGGLDEAGGDGAGEVEGPGADEADFAAVVLYRGGGGEGSAGFWYDGNETRRVLDQQLGDWRGCYAEDGYNSGNAGDVSMLVNIQSSPLAVMFDRTST